MTTNIIINFSLEGFHFWKDAKKFLSEVAFLSNSHRHMFYFTCKKRVYHDDRDIEIIMFKRTIISYLSKKYGKKTNDKDSTISFLNFGGMSCEMIAKELLESFNLTYCSVLEDNENGASIEI